MSALKEFKFEIRLWYFKFLARRSGRLGIKMRRRCLKRYFLSAGKKLSIADDVTIEVPEKISIGDNCGFNKGCWISGGGGVTIGNNVIFGPYCVIHSQNHIFDDTHKPISEQGHKDLPVVIEDDVWVASHVTITPGSKIGKGSVIGAGAVVTGEIPPYSVAAGVPAKVIKKRGE